MLVEGRNCRVKLQLTVRPRHKFCRTKFAGKKKRKKGKSLLHFTLLSKRLYTQTILVCKFSKLKPPEYRLKGAFFKKVFSKSKSRFLKLFGYSCRIQTISRSKSFLFLKRKVSFSLEGCLATAACSGNRLTIGKILYISASINKFF